MKLVVVGGVAGGASAAARVRRLDAKAEVVVFERGEHVSFSNCALPYHLGGVVESADDLIMMFPEDFKVAHDIDVHTRHEVVAINRDNKIIIPGGSDCIKPGDSVVILAKDENLNSIDDIIKINK